jgi:hypothetical protein
MEVILPLVFLLAIWAIVILGSEHFNKNVV